jgi:ferric enterobactin receptor
MKYWFCVPLMVCTGLQSFAQEAQKVQNPGQITGKILDSASSKPIDYASVSVFTAGSTKPIGGSVSDEKGLFSLDNLPLGSYRITIDFVGYSMLERKNISLTAGHPFVKLNNLRLSSVTQTLSGVTVTAQKGLIENKIDKMVYNAEKDITSQGGVATDLLKKIPMISVDIDGNVELQGNSNIRFLINGKPSSIFGNNLADALQSIPASQIRSIEVITSPGAKYDAEGTGGIINIILKDSKVQGINGNINLSAGSRLENGSLNLNARKGNFGVNAYFSGNAQVTSTTLNSMDRPSYDSTGKTTSDLQQNGQSQFQRNGFETGLGFEWTVNKRNTISGGVGYDNFGNHSQNLSNQLQINYDSLGNPSNLYSIIHSLNRFRGQSMDWNLAYRKSFPREEQQLEILYQSSYGNNASYFEQNQSNLLEDSLYGGSYSNNRGIDRETSFQADYTQPFSENVKLETGAKMDIRRITSNTDAYTLNTLNSQYLYDTTQSNALVYNRQVYAGYASLSFPAFKWLDIKAGLRYERTVTSAQFFKVSDPLIPSYDTWAPSLMFSHSFDPSHSITASYTKRIQRPGYRQLNPFVNASDPKNISEGNPLLKPEIGNNYQLAYNRSFEKGGSLNIVFFYRQSSQDIQPFIVYYPSYKVGDSLYTNVSVNTPQNIGVENNYGLNIYGSIPLGPKINVRTNLSFFDRYIQNAIVPGSNISSFNYRVNMNITYQVSKSFVAEAFGNFNSPRNEVQGRFPSFTYYNLAFRKLVWNKKGSFGFTTTNPFNQYVIQTTSVNGTGFILNSTRKVPFRSFGLSFMYKFGKLEFKKDKNDNNERPNPGVQDEGGG